MSKKPTPAKSPAKPAAPKSSELSEKQLDQAAGGLIFNGTPYYPRHT